MRIHRAGLAARDVSVTLSPVLALVVVRVWIGSGGPATASAAPEVAPPTAELSNYKQEIVSSEEERLLAKVSELDKVEAPDVFPERINLAALVPTLPRVWDSVQEPEVVVDEPQAVPTLVVTSIMDGRHPIAIIDGQARRVGDRVGAGWIIKSIADGKVTIVHLDGRIRDFTIERFSP